MGGLWPTVLKHSNEFSTVEHQAQKPKKRKGRVIFSYFSKLDGEYISAQ